MVKTLKLYAAVAIFLLLLVAPAFATAYSGQVEWGTPPVLRGYDGKNVMQAELAAGQDAPTRGIIPVGGKLYSTGKGYIMAGSATGAVSVDVVTLAGADFASPTGTTTGLGAKVINNGVKSGGIWYAQAGDASGNAGVYRSAALPAGTANIGDVDVLTLAGVEYSGTIGSTTGPTKGAVILGIDAGGIYRVPTTDTAGDLQVDIKGSIPAGSATIGNITATDYAATSGTTDNKGTKIIQIGGESGGVPYVLHTDTSGDAQVDVLTLPAITGTVTITGEDFGVSDGSSTAPGKSVSIAGFDGTNFQYPKTDSDGNLQVEFPSAQSVTISGAPFSGATGTTSPSSASLSGYETSSGDMQPGKVDIAGNQKVAPMPNADASSAVVNTVTTDNVVLIAAPGGSSYLSIQCFVISATGNGDIILRDGAAGTIMFRTYIGANTSIVVPAEFGFVCTAATALYVQGTAQPYTVTVKYETITP